MNIGILTSGPETWGSSRFRGFWYERAAPELFSAFGPDTRDLSGLADCDVIVFQKRQTPTDVQAMLRFKAEGRRVVYDTTDPMWWWLPETTTAMIENADCVVCSNDGLRAAVEEFNVKRVEVITDRMLPSHHPTAAQHGERETVTLVWFGTANNRVALAGAIPVLEHIANTREIKLRIVDDAPGLKMAEAKKTLDIEYVPWSLETFHAQMTACDIALLPPYPGLWGTMKSNNKIVTAWWCGLPVVDAECINEVLDLVDRPSERVTRGATGRMTAENEYDIATSVREWRELAESL